MRNRLAVLVLLLSAALGYCGCKRTEMTTTGAGTPITTDTAQIVAEIRRYQEATGSDLRALSEELKRQQSAQDEKLGDPPVVRDLAVARGALSEAKEAAEAKDAEATAARLSRLERVTLCLAAELPAMLVAQQVDRALQIIRQQEAAGSREFMAASLALLQAAEVAVKGRPSALVPDVLPDLDAARSSLDAGKPDEARVGLSAALDKAAGHPSVQSLARMRQAVRGAQEALGRQAWPVVAAELAELDGRLKELGGALGAEAALPAKKEATPAPAAAPRTPATSAPPAEAPAKAPTTGSGQTPASSTPAASPTTPAPAASDATETPKGRTWPWSR